MFSGIVSRSLHVLAIALMVTVGLAQRAVAQDYIAATTTFNRPAPCSDVQLGGVDILLFGEIKIHHVPSPWRGNAEWKAIIVDPGQPPNLQPPTILEGWVSPQPSDQKSSDQSTSEVAEED